MREIDTRLVPHDHIEVAYALNRRDDDRTPIPQIGQQVFYRRHMWDQEPTLATVLAIADMDDRTDPNLWHPLRDHNGQLICDDGAPRMVRAPDPLPWVDLEPRDAVDAFDEAKKPRCDDCGHTHEARVARTWEARVRGMPGWLPLNWQDRDIRLPGEILLQPIKPAHIRWAAQQARG